VIVYPLSKRVLPLLLARLVIIVRLVEQEVCGQFLVLIACKVSLNRLVAIEAETT